MTRTIVITGASDGIGAAAARALAKDGHRVIVVGRSQQKTAAVAREIGAQFFIADFARLDDVRNLAQQLRHACPTINVLANNAGGVFGTRDKTVDGFEKTFQVNHLAPFLLTQLLMDTLVSNKAAIIQTSSSGARIAGKLDMDDLEHNKDFTPTLAYGTVKLQNILFTRELDRRFGGLGITAAAFHPGVVATSFATQSDSFLKHLYNSRLARLFMTSPQKGAGQLVWLAKSKPGVDWLSGTYYENYRPARKNNPQIFDTDLARRLWDHSEELLRAR